MSRSRCLGMPCHAMLEVTMCTKPAWKPVTRISVWLIGKAASGCSTAQSHVGRT